MTWHDLFRELKYTINKYFLFPASKLPYANLLSSTNALHSYKTKLHYPIVILNPSSSKQNNCKTCDPYDARVDNPKTNS